MPKLDKTGPMGQGPRTGRGFGCCGRGTFDPRLSNEDKLTELENKEKMFEEELSLLREEKASLMTTKKE